MSAALAFALLATAPPALLADHIIIDKGERTLAAFSNGRLLARFSGIKLGARPSGHKKFEGDERTPEGDYRIDFRNTGSRYHLALRISYPDRVDRGAATAIGRQPGGDIFIHGQPGQSPFVRLPWDWTDGCIALSNAEMDRLWALVPTGTRVTIRR
ncbi:L,D-transpeptidase family protein [Sandarakinorhabdus sp.]|uniref:L,D-transpeptidase family protein n=1 Tax=Sandarakinorhabdus sp. TaxID=1916663 RepID=UPI00286DAA47|nr:L,D-transpeptidase family protein [Sandarakinorhabdus sp.]